MLDLEYDSDPDSTTVRRQIADYFARARFVAPRPRPTRRHNRMNAS